MNVPWFCEGGMRDRLLPDYQKQHYFGEKIASMKIHHTYDAAWALAHTSDDVWKNDQGCGIVSSLNLSDHGTTPNDMCGPGASVVVRNGSGMSVRKPAGMPLAKPPMLPRVTNTGLCRSGKISDSINCIDDEDLSSDDSVMCYSKIYKLREVANDMNPDERLFLEAACALSASAAPPRSQKTLVAIETKKRSLENASDTLAEIETKKRSQESPLAALEQVSAKKKRNLKQKCPMGPPPFVLRSVRKRVEYSRAR
jgi:hypothetical protein